MTPSPPANAPDWVWDEWLKASELPPPSTLNAWGRPMKRDTTSPHLCTAVKRKRKMEEENQ